MQTQMRANLQHRNGSDLLRGSLSSRAVAARGPLVARAALDRRLVGTWDKCPKRSTPMDQVADLVGLSGLVREGIKLLRGCELSVDGSSFRMGVFSAVPMVKITENYPLSGVEAANMRRDLRFGSCRGSLSVTPEGMPQLRMRWEEPYRGEGLDVFVLVPPAAPGGREELHVTSSVTVGDRTVSYTSVHTRR